MTQDYNTAANTDPPPTRCGMCGGRCKPVGRRWITCRGRCAWSSHDPRRVGLRWWLRVQLGVRSKGDR